MRVLIADDHDLFRRGLARLLNESGMEVVGEAADGARAIELALELTPDIVVMDLHMPVMSGTDATRGITAAGVPAKIIVLTVSAEEDKVIDALLAGACGYLLKDSDGEQIIGAIEAAAQNETVISPRVAAKVVDRIRREPGLQPSGGLPAPLTGRELEVLRLGELQGELGALRAELDERRRALDPSGRIY